MLVDVGLVHAAAEWGEVAGFFEGFDGGLALGGQVDVPPRKSADNDADDAGDDAQHDVVDGHEALDVGRVGEDLGPDPGARSEEAEEAEEGRVDEEEEEGLVVAQADTCRQPRAVVVHLEHAAAAGGAVVGAVGLAGLALFAEAQFAVGLNSERGGRGRGVCRECAVAIVVGGAAGRGKDGGGVAPVGHEVERDAEECDRFSCWGPVRSSEKTEENQKKSNTPSQVTFDGVAQRLTRTKTAQVVRP